MDAPIIETQLELVDGPGEQPAKLTARRSARWRLNERERQVGLRGIAQARQALAEARCQSSAHRDGDVRADAA
ncbi:MAG: hypothetical protein N2037_10050 [Acidimicrobiales bacterium]|nr:hypothetical protein [Acidimicrobiales bacterium]